MSHTAWFFGVFVILFLAWLFTGGPLDTTFEKPFLHPPAPIGSGGTYGFDDDGSGGTNDEDLGDSDTGSEDYNDDEEDTSEEASTFGGQASIRDIHLSEAQDPDEEYLEIVASYNNTQPINITGWKLRSATTNKTVTIGAGAALPRSGQVNQEQSISLGPGERALVLTGRSPIGSSFRLNSCTGYFEQFQDYFPPLPEECPHVRDNDFPTGINNRITDECIEFMENLPSCRAHTLALPGGLGPVCTEYISKEVSYAGCVAAHQSDSDFYKGEWRIYLKRDQILWKKKRETVRLLDTNDKLISSISY